MNTDQLNVGKELHEKIESCKSQLSRWRNAVSLTSTVELKCVVNGDSRTNYAASKYINFDVLKTLTIDAIQKELNRLEDEFNKL